MIAMSPGTSCGSDGFTGGSSLPLKEPVSLGLVKGDIRCGCELERPNTRLWQVQSVTEWGGAEASGPCL